MASATFIILQLVTVASATGSWTALIEASLTPPPPQCLTPIRKAVSEAGGFFVELDLAEAVSEAVLVLTVFGIVSAILALYRRRTRKTLAPSKRKAPPASANPPWRKMSSRGGADMFNGHAEMGAGAKQAPTIAPGLTSRSRTECCTTLKDPAKFAEADAIASAIRAGRASELPEILDAALGRAQRKGMPASEEDLASQLLLTALRACAASRCFEEAIAAWEHWKGRIGGGSAHLWSVLLYIVVEARSFSRCKCIFERLCKHTNPSAHDFVNMVRCYAAQEDTAGLHEALQNLRNLGHSIEPYTWNRALSACAASESVLDLADELLSAGICAEGLDSVSYNTLMKLNARAGKITRCFQLRDEMSKKGLEASEVTFGILLNVCVAAKELDRAREVFDDLCSSGLQLNVVHCTSFIKVLVGARRLDEAAGVLREMVASPGVKPDLITYSTLVRAYVDNGDVHSALKTLELMIQQDVKPDEIVFNSVLSCCFTFPMKSANVMRAFETLVGHGLRPTTTTLSILLKCLAHSEAWSVSLQVLQGAPKNHGLEAEPRLYAQLAQACVKARNADSVLGVFKAMVESARRRGNKLDTEAVGRCFRSCLLAGELDVAGQLFRLCEQEGVVVDAQIEKMMKTALAKRTRAARA